MPLLDKRQRIKIGIITFVVVGGTMAGAILKFGFEEVIPWIRVFAFVSIVIAAVEITVFTQRQRRQARGLVDGLARFENEIGIVVRRLGPDGKIRVLGEIWDASTVDGISVDEEIKVRIVSAERGRLIVRIFGDTGSNDARLQNT